MNSNRISTDELRMVRDLIIIQHMEDMVLKSIEDVEHSAVLGQMYARIGEALLKRMMEDRNRLKREIKAKQIKIMDPEHSDFIIYHKLICRGYEENFGMTRDVMRTEISNQLTQYVGDMKQAL